MEPSTIKNAVDNYFKSTNTYPQGLRAVLFDMDGVLFDSMPAHAKAWKKVAEEYNLDTTLSEFYMYEGQTAPQTINIIFNRNKGRDATSKECYDIYKRKTELFIKYNKVKKIDNIDSVITELNGIRKTIVTGSSQPSLIDKIERYFPKKFELNNMITGKDVKVGKPNPEPYIKGLKSLGIKSNQAIVIENAPMGVRASVASGTFTIAVNTGIIDDTVLLKEQPNILYKNMYELSLDIPIIINLFNNNIVI